MIYTLFRYVCLIHVCKMLFQMMVLQTPKCYFKKIKLESKPSETLVKGVVIIMCVGDTCCDRSICFHCTFIYFVCVCFRRLY